MNVTLNLASRNFFNCVRSNLTICHLGHRLPCASSTYWTSAGGSVRCFGSLVPQHEKFENGKSNIGLNVLQKRFYNRKKTVKIPPTKVLKFDYGGDLSYDDYPVDLKQPRLEFKGAEQLEHCDEVTKRLLTLEFGDGQAKLKSKIYNLVSKVKEHPLDIRSQEVLIAYQTVAIRNQIRHVLSYRKDKAAKSLLVLRLQARRKHLRRLRAMDYEKFTWLCEELQMKYVPTPQYNRRLSKLATLKKVAREEALRIMKEKMDAFKVKLLQEKDEFMAYKEEELMKIEEEIKDLSLSDSDPIKEIFHAIKDKSLNEIDGNPKPLRSRREMILTHKFKLAEKIAKERETKV